MKEKQKMQKYVLGIVQNPLPVICLIYADDSGKPAWKKVNYTAFADGTPIPAKLQKPAKRLVETIDPRGAAGHYHATRAEVVDATPRTYDDAMALALKFAPGDYIKNLPNWWDAVRAGKHPDLCTQS